MKKKVKGLIVAASVAAIAGIGAVSFAAWQNDADSMKNKVTGGQTATITAIGFNAPDTTVTGLLVPYDQVEGYDMTTMTNVYNVKLPVVGDAIDAYKIKVTITATAAEGKTWQGEFKVLLDKTATATVDGKTDLSSWTAVTSGTKADITGTTELKAGDYYAHVVLTSEKSDDMNAGLKIEFVLEK